MNMDFVYVRTKDDLRLMGIHYEPENKDTAVLLIHGMSGNIIENFFGNTLGKTLTKEGLGFIYSHNRGYNHINDIATSELKEKGGYKTVRVGEIYEIFEDSLLDIDAWIEKVRELGYKKIILMGHSLGCNKVIYYFSMRKPKDVTGVILASPPDMLGLLKPEYQPDSEELRKEAKENMQNGEPKKLLSKMLWDWFYLSSQTFLSLFTEGNNADNLPILRNPEKWSQLASINVPIFAFLGEYDDIVIRSLKEDLDLIKSKATSTPNFKQAIIPKSSHNYEGQEKALVTEVLSWLKSL
jgi:pimeloyl-ACP methyl ester carboxylesterase